MARLRNMWNTSFITLVLCVAFVKGDSLEAFWRCPRHLRHTTLMTSYGGNCFQFVNQEVYWPSANEYCQRHGGRLVKVDSPDINAFIVRTLNNLPWRNNGVWIGLHDRNGELNFEWATEYPDVNEVMSTEWNNWAGHHPKHHLHTIKDCVRAIRGSKKDWKWHESTCSTFNWKYRYICQYKMKPVTTPEPTTKATMGVALGIYGVKPDSDAHILGKKNTKSTTSRRHITPKPPPKSTTTPKATTHKATHKSTIVHKRTTTSPYYMDEDILDLVVPLQLRQAEEPAKSGGIAGGVIACLVGLVLAVLIIVIVFTRRRSSEKEVAIFHVQNPTYGGCENNSDDDDDDDDEDGTAKKRAENEYVINVYSNPMESTEVANLKKKKVPTATLR